MTRNIPSTVIAQAATTNGVPVADNAKINSHADVMAGDAAVAASLALQHGTSLETLRRALLRNSHGVASGPLGTALDLVARNRGAAS